MRTALVPLGAVLAAALAFPSPAIAQTPLTVSIESPTPGVADVHGNATTLEAVVSDPTLRTATLTIHGASYSVPIEHGRITQQLVVAGGVNRVGITVQRGDEVARDAVTWFVRGETTELLVLATWEATGEIIDLWVREPGGETCKWDHRSTERGGRLLDFSTSAIGLGSQGFVAPEVEAGTYRIKVHYWGGFGDEDQRWSGDYEQLIGELDAAELALTTAVGALRVMRMRERDRLAARLDRWALPGAPQTAVHVEAILFPGTPHERRWRFDRRVDRTGHLATLGEIEIDEALIRAARAGRER
ncbi:YfaP family protein [Sandaracinus amylolyticus]|uniref:Uncharacterized protein n=1 Tax=Sandaracinus amylolyticus TaxID=927083 RepID=A0A0F6YM88_9BACT|nr:hypothetical protein [Sandaracinus amylolyticus]AKF10695.1 hypothetical protein DB32_007844 [Sandaracinus amylolyticus]